MIENKVFLKGSIYILNKIAKLLKTPEERKLIDAQAETEESKASIIRNESILKCLKGTSEKYSIDLENLQKTTELYKYIGFPDAKIQELVGPKIDKLLKTFEDIASLNQLVDDGIILKVEDRLIELPEED